MKKWNIYGIASSSKFLGTIEAETEEEAIEKANSDKVITDECHISLCHQCANEVDLGDIHELQAEEA